MNWSSSTPVELQLAILCQLDTQDVLNAMLTCKRFAALGMDVVLQRKQDIHHLHFHVADTDLRILNTLLTTSSVSSRTRKVSLCCIGLYENTSTSHTDSVLPFTYDPTGELSEAQYKALSEAHYKALQIAGSILPFTHGPTREHIEAQYENLQDPDEDLPVVSTLRTTLVRLVALPDIHISFGCTFNPFTPLPYGWKIKMSLKLPTPSGHQSKRRLLLSQASRQQSMYLDWSLHILMCALRSVSFSSRRINFMIMGHPMWDDSDAKILSKALFGSWEDKFGLSDDEIREYQNEQMLGCAEEASTYLMTRTRLYQRIMSSLRAATMSITWVNGRSLFSIENVREYSLSYSRLVQMLCRVTEGSSDIPFRVEYRQSKERTIFREVQMLPYRHVRRLELIYFQFTQSRPIARIFAIMPTIEFLTLKMGFVVSGGWGPVFDVIRSKSRPSSESCPPLLYLELEGLYQRLEEDSRLVDENNAMVPRMVLDYVTGVSLIEENVALDYRIVPVPELMVEILPSYQVVFSSTSTHGIHPVQVAFDGVAEQPHGNE